jgi:hypothetical protein
MLWSSVQVRLIPPYNIAVKLRNKLDNINEENMLLMPMAVIGDIEVKFNNNFACITVDQETVLFIPRTGHGLSELAKALTSLVKT